MNLTKLDGFGRVKPTPINGGGTPRTRKTVKRNKIAKKRASEQRVFKDIGGAQMEVPKTKRAKRAQRISKFAHRRKMQGDGSEPNIGFSRIYVDNEPTSEQLDGFNRVRYTNKELQGLSLQGYTILQGYQLGDAEDLEDWNYLLSIEHPSTMQGFPTWVLNGRKERKARQAKRKARRSERKEKRSQKKQVRSKKKEARQERTQRRKEVRTAKKEERLQKKVQRRESRAQRQEERQKRKAQRIADRAERQKLRQETRRLKQEMKGERGRDRAGLFSNLLEQAGDIGSEALDLQRGGGDFQDFSYMDFAPDSLPIGLDDQIEMFRDMPDEDVLDMRDRDLELMDDEIEDFELDEDKKSSSMLLPIAVLGTVVALGSNKKKKKKR